MKKSARQVRLERRHKRRQGAALSLTSLMDIFTILLFFLLVSGSTSQKPPDQRYIVLPKSTAEQLPKDTVTIQVSGKDIIVQGHVVASTVDVMAQEQSVILPLKEELDYQASKSAAPLNDEGIPEREVTILMDQKMPYEVLKRIMTTCMLTEYSKVSFAVLQAGKQKKEPAS